MGRGRCREMGRRHGGDLVLLWFWFIHSSQCGFRLGLNFRPGCLMFLLLTFAMHHLLDFGQAVDAGAPVHLGTVGAFAILQHSLLGMLDAQTVET